MCNQKLFRVVRVVAFAILPLFTVNSACFAAPQVFQREYIAVRSQIKDQLQSPVRSLGEALSELGAAVEAMPLSDRTPAAITQELAAVAQLTPGRTDDALVAGMNVGIQEGGRQVVLAFASGINYTVGANALVAAPSFLAANDNLALAADGVAGDGFDATVEQLEELLEIRDYIFGRVPEDSNYDPVDEGPTVVEVRQDLLDNPKTADLFGDVIVNGQKVNVAEFIGELTVAFGPRIDEALRQRAIFAQQVLEGKAKYGFHQPDEEILDPYTGNTVVAGDIQQGLIDNLLGIKSERAWRLNSKVPVNPRLLRSGIEGTGHPALHLLMNAMNSGQSAYMADSEDTVEDKGIQMFVDWADFKELMKGPEGRWHKGGDTYHYKKGTKEKDYRVEVDVEDYLNMSVRVPSIHLRSRQIKVNGRSAPAILVAFAINVLNNYDNLTKYWGGANHYVPKIETPSEMGIITEIFMAAENKIGVETGTLKMARLNESIRYAQSQEVMLYVAREHAIKDNDGRWDFGNSKRVMWLNDGKAAPDPHTLDMLSPEMSEYHLRNGLLLAAASMGEDGRMTHGRATGGMFAGMQNNARPDLHAKILGGMFFDKVRERLYLGRLPDGRVVDPYTESWSATVVKEYVDSGTRPLVAPISDLPSLIAELTDAQRTILRDRLSLITAEGEPNIHTWTEAELRNLWSQDRWERLSRIPEGEITEGGMRWSYRMVSEYLYQALQGNTGAAINLLDEEGRDAERMMFDFATLEDNWRSLWILNHLGTRLTQDGKATQEGDVVDAALIDRIHVARQQQADAWMAANPENPQGFNRDLSPVSMDMTRRLALNPEYLPWASRVVFEVIDEEHDPERRNAILDAITAPRQALVDRIAEARVAAGDGLQYENVSLEGLRRRLQENGYDPAALFSNLADFGFEASSLWYTQVHDGQVVTPKRLAGYSANPFDSPQVQMIVATTALQALAAAAIYPGMAENYGLVGAKDLGKEADGGAVSVGIQSLERLAKAYDITIIVGGDEGSFRDQSAAMALGMVINSGGKNGVWMYLGDSIELTNGVKTMGGGRNGASSMMALVPANIRWTWDGYTFTLAAPFDAQGLEIDPVIVPQGNTLQHVLSQMAAANEADVSELTSGVKLFSLDRPKHNDLAKQARALGIDVRQALDGDPVPAMFRSIFRIPDADGDRLIVASTQGAVEARLLQIAATLSGNSVLGTTTVSKVSLKEVDDQKDQGPQSLESARRYRKADLDQLRVGNEIIKQVNAQVPGANIGLYPVTGRVLAKRIESQEALAQQLRGKAAVGFTSISGAREIDAGIVQPFLSPVTVQLAQHNPDTVTVSGSVVDEKGDLNLFQLNLRTPDFEATRRALVEANGWLTTDEKAARLTQLASARPFIINEAGEKVEIIQQASPGDGLSIPDLARGQEDPVTGAAKRYWELTTPQDFAQLIKLYVDIVPARNPGPRQASHDIVIKEGMEESLRPLLADLAYAAVVNRDPEMRKLARNIIGQLGPQFNVHLGSSRGIYNAQGRGEVRDISVPAMNSRHRGLDQVRAEMRAAVRTNTHILYPEMANSESGYTGEGHGYHGMVAETIAAAILEGFEGVLNIKMDHFQVNKAKYDADPEKEIARMLEILKVGVDARVGMFDLDTSTIEEVPRYLETEVAQLIVGMIRDGSLDKIFHEARRMGILAALTFKDDTPDAVEEIRENPKIVSEVLGRMSKTDEGQHLLKSQKFTYESNYGNRKMRTALGELLTVQDREALQYEWDKIGQTEAAEVWARISQEVRDYAEEVLGTRDVALGMETGETGTRTTTVSQAEAALFVIYEKLAEYNKMDEGPDVFSIDTGGAHGGYFGPDGKRVRGMSISWDRLLEVAEMARSPLKLRGMTELMERLAPTFGGQLNMPRPLAGSVQHGFSTNAEATLSKLAERLVVEVHLATEYQDILFYGLLMGEPFLAGTVLLIPENQLEDGQVPAAVLDDLIDGSIGLRSEYPTQGSYDAQRRALAQAITVHAYKPDNRVRDAWFKGLEGQWRASGILKPDETLDYKKFQELRAMVNVPKPSGGMTKFKDIVKKVSHVQEVLEVFWNLPPKLHEADMKGLTSKFEETYRRLRVTETADLAAQHSVVLNAPPLASSQVNAALAAIATGDGVQGDGRQIVQHGTSTAVLDPVILRQLDDIGIQASESTSVRDLAGEIALSNEVVNLAVTEDRFEVVRSQLEALLLTGRLFEGDQVSSNFNVVIIANPDSQLGRHIVLHSGHILPVVKRVGDTISLKGIQSLVKRARIGFGVDLLAIHPSEALYLDAQTGRSPFVIRALSGYPLERQVEQADGRVTPSRALRFVLEAA